MLCGCVPLPSPSPNPLTYLPSTTTHELTPPSSGIGLESAVLFATEGAAVVLADVNLDAAQKGADLITQKIPGARAIAVRTDVSKEADIKAVVDRAVKEWGRLDVMVSGG